MPKILRVDIRLDPGLKKKLVRAAAKAKLPQADIVRRLLRKHLR